MGEAAESLGAVFDDGVDEPEVAAPTEKQPEAAPVTGETPAPSEKEPEKPALTEEEQAVVRQKAFEAREAKRQAEEARRRTEELEAELAKFKAPLRQNVPEFPDRYDEDFAAKAAHRDAILAHNARVDAYEDMQRQSAAEQAQRKVWEAEQAQKAKVETYTKTAETLGVSALELREAGLAIGQYFPQNSEGQAIAEYIVDDPRGPEITVYLHKNPMELAKLLDMPPLKAAAYIESTIKPAAKRAPPTLAPEPVERLKGSGVPEKDETYGATFE